MEKEGLPPPMYPATNNLTFPSPVKTSKKKDRYQGKSAKIIGSLQIVFGVMIMLFSLGIVLPVWEDGAWFILPQALFLMIWMFITGGIGIGASKKKSRCLIIAHMVLSILACLAIVNLLIHSFAAIAISADGLDDDGYSSGSSSHGRGRHGSRSGSHSASNSGSNSGSDSSSGANYYYYPDDIMEEPPMGGHKGGKGRGGRGHHSDSHDGSHDDSHPEPPAIPADGDGWMGMFGDHDGRTPPPGVDEEFIEEEVEEMMGMHDGRTMPPGVQEELDNLIGTHEERDGERDAEDWAKDETKHLTETHERRGGKRGGRGGKHGGKHGGRNGAGEHGEDVDWFDDMDEYYDDDYYDYYDDMPRIAAWCHKSYTPTRRHQMSIGFSVAVIVVAIAMFIITIWGSALACKVTCCAPRSNPVSPSLIYAQSAPPLPQVVVADTQDPSAKEKEALGILDPRDLEPNSPPPPY